MLPEPKGLAMGFLIVFLGGGIGAALRHGVNLASARLLGTAFPFATLFENVTGSLVMGLLAGIFAFKGDASQHWRLFLTTGILGGYTTFSAFSLDAALLYERGELASRRSTSAPRSRSRSAACSPGSRWCAISPERPPTAIAPRLKHASSFPLHALSWGGKP